MSKFSVSPLGVKTMLVGLIMMIAGFILMIGGGSSDPDVFNEAMFSTVRLTVAPIVILLGIAVVMVGILRRPKNKEE
ncbi:MAG: DUF3098 domain-containing protein [Bacteroidales bacterium]|nr:DUF3098 domain-containing protein [Bacteroidales bacterium]